MTFLQKKILIIIPCFNEEASIASLLKQCRETVFPIEYAVDIIVINDSSEDKTSQIAKEHYANVIDLTVNLGIGGAMQTGYKYAKEHFYDFAIQLDGDGQHPASELCKLILAQEQTKANVIIGSRFLEKQGYQSTLLRRSGIGYLNWLNTILTGVKVHDPTSGFRMFDKKAIAIAAKRYPDEYPEPESLVLFSKKKLLIKEVPVIMKERVTGKSSISSINSIYYCLKVSISMFYTFLRLN